MNNLKAKIRDVITLTDLAEYLKVSRPTLYKLIDNYDNGLFENIDKKYLELFNYINDNQNISKKHVINYIVKSKIISVESNVHESLSSFVYRYEYTNSIDENQGEAIKNILLKKNLGYFINLINRYCFLTEKNTLSNDETKELIFLNYIKDLTAKKEILPEEIISNYIVKKGGNKIWKD